MVVRSEKVSIGDLIWLSTKRRGILQQSNDDSVGKV